MEVLYPRCCGLDVHKLGIVRECNCSSAGRVVDFAPWCTDPRLGEGQRTKAMQSVHRKSFIGKMTQMTPF